MVMKQECGNGIASGLLWKLGERTLAQGISFVVSIVLARMLLPEEYGIVALVMIFIIFADVFVTSGFSTSLIQKKDADETDFSTIFYCSLVVSLFLYVILYLAAPFIAKFYRIPNLSMVLRIFALRLPLSSYNSVQHAYVSRNMLFRKFFYSTLFGTILSGVVGIAMAYAGIGVWALVGQYLTNTVVDSIILSITISWRPRLLFSWDSAKKLMSYGWKVLAADLSGTFFEQLRSLIIGKFYTSNDLAYYNRGKSFASLITDNISTSVISVLFPALSNIKEDAESVKSMIRHSIKIMSYLIFPIIGGLVVVAKPMVFVLLTEKWVSSIPFLQILCISSSIGLIGNVSLQAIKAVGRSDVILKLEYVKKPVYVILLIVGVKISVIAVAVTMLIYSVYSTFVNTKPLKKLIGYSYKEQVEDLSVALFLTTIMVIFVAMAGVFNMPYLLQLIFQVAIGILVYFISSVLIKPEAFTYLWSYVKTLSNSKKGTK